MRKLTKRQKENLKENLRFLAVLGIVGLILVLCSIQGSKSADIMDKQYREQLEREKENSKFEMSPADNQIVGAKDEIETLPIIEPTFSETEKIEETTKEISDVIARCVMAEAGNQDNYGKRLVVDVILNRADYYGITPEEVIYQPYQFEVVDLGMMNNTPDDDIYQIIEEEMANRTNYDVFYFRTDYYHSFGVPLFRHQDHYFSRRED